MAGAEAGDALDLGVDGFDGHLLGPVHPVAVRDPEGDGRAEREAVADAGGDLGAVLLDLHAPAAAVAALAAGHVDGDVVLGEGQAGGEALDEGGEALAVALAGGEEAEASHQEACRSSSAPGMGGRAMGAASPASVVSQAVSKRARISAGARLVPVDAIGVGAVSGGGQDRLLQGGPAVRGEGGVHVHANAPEAEVGNIVQHHLHQPGGEGEGFVERGGDLLAAAFHRSELAFRRGLHDGEVGGGGGKLGALHAGPEAGGHVAGRAGAAPGGHRLEDERFDDLRVARGDPPPPGAGLEHLGGDDPADEEEEREPEDGADDDHGASPARAARAASRMASRGAGRPVQSSKASAPWWMSMGRPPRTGSPASRAARRRGVSSGA